MPEWYKRSLGFLTFYPKSAPLPFPLPFPFPFPPLPFDRPLLGFLFQPLPDWAPLIPQKPFFLEGSSPQPLHFPCLNTSPWISRIPRLFQVRTRERAASDRLDSRLCWSPPLKGRANFSIRSLSERASPSWRTYLMRSQAIGGPRETGLGRHCTKYKAQDPWLASVLPTAAAGALPENLLEMQILQLSPDLLNHKLWRGAQHSVF